MRQLTLACGLRSFSGAERLLSLAVRLARLALRRAITQGVERCPLIRERRAIRLATG